MGRDSVIPHKFQSLLASYDEHVARLQRLSEIDIHETPQQKIARVGRLERDYIAWFEYYFKEYASARCAKFHREMAEMVIRHRVINFQMEAFRSSAKSVHLDMGIPLFLMFTGELKYMLLVGETETKAQRLLSALQAQLQYNRRLTNDYGNRFNTGDWSKGEFLTTDGVRFLSIGFGQNPRGAREGSRRPDYIVVDDVDNRRHVNNDRLMREGVEWIFEDLMGCFNDADCATRRFAYANNNFHKNSITNRLKAQFKALAAKSREAGRKPVHRVMTVNAVESLSTFRPTWPEKTTAAYWREKFSTTPYRSFMREYMNTHVEEGAVFRFENMQWKEMLPLREYDALAFYGDLSYKDAACFKGMILVGKKGREFHIIHTFLRQSSRPTLARWLYDLYEDRLRDCRKIRYWIEGFFSMDDFINDFDAEGDQRGYYIPIKADKRPKDDKYDRIEASQGFFERRNVWFNAAEKESADQIELVDQYLAFEKGNGAMVDGPDAVEGAFSKLNSVGRLQSAQYRSQAIPSRKF